MGKESDIITLSPGQVAPSGADHIRIEPLPLGGFRWLASVVQGEALTFTEAETDTFEEAKIAGSLWAKSRGARLLYVEDGRPDSSGNEP